MDETSTTTKTHSKVKTLVGYALVAAAIVAGALIVRRLVQTGPGPLPAVGNSVQTGPGPLPATGGQ